MASLCHTDASHPDPNDTKFPLRLVGSKLLLEDFNGYDGVASTLQTSLEVGIGSDKKEI